MSPLQTLYGGTPEFPSTGKKRLAMPWLYDGETLEVRKEEKITNRNDWKGLVYNVRREKFSPKPRNVEKEQKAGHP